MVNPTTTATTSRRPRAAPSAIAAWVAGLSAALAVLLGAGACVDRQAAVARHMGKAENAIENREYQKARVELRNAVRLDPVNVEGILMLGSLAERNESWRRAYSLYQRALDTDQFSVPAHNAQAQLLLRFGETERALELVERALELAPTDGEAQALAGWLALRGGDVAAARGRASDALRTSPDLPLALSLASELELRSGNVGGGLALLQEAVDRQPADDVLRRLFARALAGQGHYSQAIAQQQQVVELAPDERDFRITLAALHASAGEVDAAATVLRETYEAFASAKTAGQLARLVVSQFPPAQVEPTLRDLVAEYPNTFAFSAVLAGVYERGERWQEARAVLEGYIANEQDSPQALDAQVQLARQALLTGDPAGARRVLEEVLERNPRAVDALILRSQLHRQDRRPELAVQDLRLALDAGEKVVHIRRLLAQAHAENGELGPAVDSLLEAVQLTPADSKLRLSLAKMALRAGRLTLAEGQLDAAVEIGVETAAALELRFHLAESRGDLALATTLAERLREDVPAQGHYLLARIRHRQGRLAEARDGYLQALDHAPGAPEVVDGLVRTLVALGQQDEAMTLLQERLVDHPDDVRATLLMADVQRYAEPDTDVSESFEQLIAEHPSWWLPYARLAALRLQAGASAPAREVLRRGLQATDGNPLLGEQLAALEIADGDMDSAIAVYETLIEAHPALPRVANNLAMLLVTHRDDADSLSRAVHLTESFVNTRNAAYLDTAGWVRLKQGELQIATSLLQEAVRAAPGRPTQHYHLAVAYLRTGDEQAAVRELEVALASTQPFPERDRAQRTVDQLRSDRVSATAPAS